MDAHAADHETRLEADDHFALKLWLRILTCSNLIEARIRHNLRRDFECTLPRFDLLAQLDRSEALKMSELSQRLMVTGGNVTGLADQLQDEGWLVREPVEHDRRATRLRLTEAGRERFGGMARTHEDWVVEMLAALSRDEQRLLHGLLGKLKLGLRPPAPSGDGSATDPAPDARKPSRPRPGPQTRPRRAAAAVSRGASRGTVTPIVRPRGKVRP
ncbi:MAG: MarR family transcriptional regulator [Burkholderiales bacterium]|nr:MAG: MarR family transcriptional regulator [Burkholderiales bacterium]